MLQIIMTIAFLFESMCVIIGIGLSSKLNISEKLVWIGIVVVVNALMIVAVLAGLAPCSCR